MKPGPCARCGRTPALGWSQIGDDWYCHGDDVDVTCYMHQSFTDVVRREVVFRLIPVSGGAWVGGQRERCHAATSDHFPRRPRRRRCRPKLGLP